jgi:hypothetical protein
MGARTRPPPSGGPRCLRVPDPTFDTGARFAPGQSRSARNRCPGAPFDLSDPVGFRMPLAGHVRLKGDQQLGHDPGAIIVGETKRFSEEAIDGIIHRSVLVGSLPEHEAQRPKAVIHARASSMSTCGRTIRTPSADRKCLTLWVTRSGAPAPIAAARIGTSFWSARVRALSRS